MTQLHIGRLMTLWLLVVSGYSHAAESPCKRLFPSTQRTLNRAPLRKELHALSLWSRCVMSWACRFIPMCTIRWSISASSTITRREGICH